MYPTALRNAARPLPRCFRAPVQRGLRISSKLSIPYGFAASAKAATASAVTVRTLACSSLRLSAIQSTKPLRWGKMAQPMRMGICCTILTPVCLACQDFLLRHTARRKGKSAGIPRAEATTAKARAVVLRTYSSTWSISGRIVLIMVARPAAFARLEMISRPSTRA